LRPLVAFVRLGRPLFLVGGLLGFALGAALARNAGHALSVSAYLWGQGTVTAFHLMVHYANDYFDQAGDAIAARTPFSGGSGVLAAGELPPRAALYGAYGCALLGLVGVAHAAGAGNAVAAALALVMAILAWAYSAPPLRLLARGLGEIDTVAVVAVLVPLVGYAWFAHRVDAAAFAITAPGVCAMFAMMLCVEVPDRDADAATAKRTLVVRWGIARALTAASAAAFAAAALLVAVPAGTFSVPLPRALVAALPTALLALALAVTVSRGLPRAVVPLLGVTLYAVTAFANLVLIAT
jgi:1,4-dihydroxy-2-naphthoate octaprenyltransferase